MTRIRSIRLALWGLVLVAGTLALLLWLQPAPDGRDLLADLGRGDYALVTTAGEPFTQASLAGEPTAVFFGFTHCPEVCPTTLGEIGTWQGELADAGEAPLRTFFITVDPERDTLDALGDYVSWVPDVVGVTGTPEEVDEALRAFRIYAARVPLEGGGYTMDHSANVLLFDAEGRFSGTVAYREETERALAAIRRAVEGA